MAPLQSTEAQHPILVPHKARAQTNWCIPRYKRKNRPSHIHCFHGSEPAIYPASVISSHACIVFLSEASSSSHVNLAQFPILVPHKARAQTNLCIPRYQRKTGRRAYIVFMGLSLQSSLSHSYLLMPVSYSYLKQVLGAIFVPHVVVLPPRALLLYELCF